LLTSANSCENFVVRAHEQERRGEPWRNGMSNRSTARVRDECLNINIFWSLAQARMVITDWKDDYNHRRRHSSLGYQTPAVYAAACTHR
jgi:putative transposase